jgi:hypothetical protein
MRPKFTLLALSVLSTFALQNANATTIILGAIPTARTITDADTTTTITTGIALVGTFTSEAFTFNPALSISANVAAITTAGGWTQFAAPATMAINGTGKVGTAGITDNTAAATAFNNQPLYLWVFNAATPGAATEMGIFRATTATVPWTFPVNGFGVSDNPTISSTSIAAPTLVAIGNTGSTTTGAGTTVDPGKLILAKPVPEPSTLALGGLAGLGMLSSRWRRRR